MTDRNRRRHRRVPLKQVATRLTGAGALHIGLSVENMSLGGCFVRCPTPMKVGTEVKLQVHRPGVSQTIDLFGRVVSTAMARPHQPSGMGIAFDPMPRDVSQRVEGLVGAVDPLAVRVTAQLPETRTERELPVVMAGAESPSVEVAELRVQLEALGSQLKKRDNRIAELEAQVDRLKLRLAHYGGKP